MARGQLLESGLLQRLGDLDARRLELARGSPQDTCPRVLGAVDAVAEAHDALAAVEQIAHVLGDVIGVRHLVEHLEDAGRGAAVERAGESADGRGHRGRAVRAGRGDDAAGEGGGVGAVLGRARPSRSRSPAHDAGRPPLASAGGSARPPCPPSRRSSSATRSGPRRGLGDDRDHRGREPREVVARLGVGHVDELLQAPLACERGGRGLEVRHRAAGLRRQVDVLRRAASPGRSCRRRGGPRPSRRGRGRRAPRCPLRGSGARCLPCRARRSPSRRRRRPRGPA